MVFNNGSLVMRCLKELSSLKRTRANMEQRWII